MTIRGGISRRPWRAAVVLALVSLLAIAAGPLASAQDASPPAEVGALNVSVHDVDGNELGVLSFVQVDGLDAVRITGELHGLKPGEHGLHIHEFGICDASGDEPFSSAGGHFNPTGVHHGPGPLMGATPSVATPVSTDMDAHAGDLGNITANDNGDAVVDITSERITLAPGEANSLDDADGSAIVVHQDPDDLHTDPSGNSGPRIACGVIFAGSGATPVAIETGA
jgi:Cu-Zn family superoxide dismutase